MSPKSHNKRPLDPLNATSPPDSAIRKGGAIRVVRPGIVIGMSAEDLNVAQMAACLVGSELDRLNNLPEQLPLDWAQAVRIAAARVSEKFDMHDGDSNPALMEMAQELAVFLCSYGKLAEEADRMAARAKTADKASDPTPSDTRRFDNTPGGHQRRGKRRLFGRIKVRPVGGGPGGLTIRLKPSPKLSRHSPKLSIHSPRITIVSRPIYGMLGLK